MPLSQCRTAPGVTPSSFAAAVTPPTEETHVENAFIAQSIRFVWTERKPEAYIMEAQSLPGFARLAPMKTWYEKARELMDVKDIKIRALADTLGMTPGGVGHYLSGRRHPKPGMLKKIAHRIGVSVSELIEDDPSFARDEEEQEVLEVLRQIPQSQRQAALSMLRGLSAGSNSTPAERPPAERDRAAA